PKAPHGPHGPQGPHGPHGPHHGKHGGVSVTIHDGKVDISGIDGMVRGQLEGVRQMLKNDPNIPKELRDKALARLDKVRGIVDKRLGKIKGKKIDDLGEELEQMGEEIEQAMEGLDEELEKLGEKLGKDYSSRVPKDFNFNFDFDHDDDDDDDLGGVPVPDLDGDDDDLRQSITDLKGMALKPAQKAQITKIRADADRSVAVAKQALDAASHKLEVALADPKTSDADIARHVDQISGHEATIRKTRILAWVSARRILDDAQRKKIEAAAQAKKSR
ncbi:MAG: hypothetical protein M3619_14385, partial [Myxococcota bacterium]|nr:hypothetical protein [Myxococcota bacterium]